MDRDQREVSVATVDDLLVVSAAERRYTLTLRPRLGGLRRKHVRRRAPPKRNSNRTRLLGE